MNTDRCSCFFFFERNEREKEGIRRKKERMKRKMRNFRVSALLYQDRSGLLGPVEPAGPVRLAGNGSWAQEKIQFFFFSHKNYCCCTPFYCGYPPLFFFAKLTLFFAGLDLDFLSFVHISCIVCLDFYCISIFIYLCIIIIIVELECN
jgi:hypothetical protein